MSHMSKVYIYIYITWRIDSNGMQLKGNEKDPFAICNASNLSWDSNLGQRNNRELFSNKLLLFNYFCSKFSDQLQCALKIPSIVFITSWSEAHILCHRQTSKWSTWCDSKWSTWCYSKSRNKCFLCTGQPCAK